jgi:hypothetical protein
LTVSGGLTVSAGTTAIDGAVNIGGATQIANALTVGSDSPHSIDIGDGRIEISHATMDNKRSVLNRGAFSCYAGTSTQAVLSNSGLDLYQGNDIKLNSYGTGDQENKEIMLTNNKIRAEDTDNYYTEIDYNSVYIKNNTGTLISNMEAGVIQFSQGANTLSISANALGIQPGSGGKEVTLTVDTLKMTAPSKETNIQAGELYVSAGAQPIVSISESYGINMVNDKTITVQKDSSTYTNITGEKITVRGSLEEYAELKYWVLEFTDDSGTFDIRNRFGKNGIEINSGGDTVTRINSAFLNTTGGVIFSGLPDSGVGLYAGQLYRDGADVKVKT